MRPIVFLSSALLALFTAACASTEPALEPAVQESPARASAASPLDEAGQHFEAGRFAEAAAAYDRALAAGAMAGPDQGEAWFRYGYSLHAIGDLERALPAHEHAATFPAFAPIATYNVACVHALRGRPDAAFAALDRAAALGFKSLEQLDGDMDLVSLHADPRWAALRAHLAPMAATVHNELDFWVGDWTVANANGDVLGRNHITRELDGHLLAEEWSGARGGKGQSISYFDRDAQRWKQVWVDRQGGLLEMSGTFEDGTLHLVGRYQLPGAEDLTVEHRTALSVLPDGRLRQQSEESRDGGKSWESTNDVFYTRATEG